MMEAVKGVKNCSKHGSQTEVFPYCLCVCLFE